MKQLRIPSMVLALILQVAPVCRVVCLNQVMPPTGFAIVLKFLAGAAALLGTYDAWSAASAAISGVSTTNPIGPVTTNAVGTVGQPFSYRIIVTNPGKNPGQAYWNAAPLPPGLTINTNAGANGWITGTPTAAGVYPVLLTAGNLNFDNVVNLNITITINGAVSATPPQISSGPTSQITLEGSTVSFTVAATGPNLSYQWSCNKTNIANSNNSTLTLANVTTNQSGMYSVQVSNPAGSTNSPSAQLLVVSPPGAKSAPQIQEVMQGPQGLALSFQAAPGYRYILQSTDSLQSGSWVEVTNVPPAFVGSTLTVPQAALTGPQRYYRIQVTAN